MTSVTRSPNAKCGRWPLRGVSQTVKAIFFVVWLVTFLVTALRARGESNGTSEYDVKAAFLFHFAQFVEWPPDSFKDANSPLTYCTVGEDPFQGALDESVKGKIVANRSLRVLHLRERDPIEGCQVLFISQEHKKREEEELANVNGHAVLTVGETEHFALAGGVIGFCLEEKRVRFEINLEAAGKARLKISAKLLALAKTVLGNPKGN